MAEAFEQLIRDLTVPINGQYPRPWMTAMQDPLHANVFIVGRNQSRGFSPDLVGSHDDYLDALFNRNGRNCRATYDMVNRATGKGASPTRRNIDGLTERLTTRGVNAVLETNVICYSTPMSADLRLPQHQGGLQRGTAIFWSLLCTIRPRVLIAHGVGTIKGLERLLGITLPQPADHPGQAPAIVTCCLQLDGKSYEFSVITVASLAPPEWHQWSRWAPQHLDDVADLTAHLINGTKNLPLPVQAPGTLPMTAQPALPASSPKPQLRPETPEPGTSLTIIPAQVRTAWIRLRDHLAPHGLADAIVPQRSRVSLKLGTQRYLKFDYQSRQWVFCRAIGNRMDHLDPDRLCPRGDTGTRGQNAVAHFDGLDLTRLYPVLDRLAAMMVSDYSR